ncbi:two-component system regulatory protein [Leifsonia xyli subsp. cynodontis DSM 46306]|uniref:Transcriptional regulatory protein n=1 Tax=Leifsonia xyli subsp. cynodontis DSM 46306 TaxID=1389489 RepID=U3P7C9_LEIXC|nr:response regulator [Leifsonia xyli]AGW40842.1 two-component system regulatory protein [Leifsonia xyli subsp. cynodontis DSM 46306]
MSVALRVLVVDDDFRVAGLHRDIVAARRGFTALEPVTTARAARTAVREHAPDLVLLDVFLPDGDGLAVLAELDVDAFVVSAASDGASVRRALRSGALAYLVKPFAARLLAERLDAYQRYRNVLRDGRAADQEAIERALRILHSGDAVAPASRSATEQLVLAELRAGEVAAADVAATIGVSRATAQRYLAALAARGVAEVALRYGATGRPEHRYRLTPTS